MSTPLTIPKYLDNPYFALQDQKISLEPYKRPKRFLDVDWGIQANSYLDKQIIKYKESSISFEIKNHKFELSSELKDIYKAIQKNKCLLELKYDWDDEGASATNIETFIKAIKFIVDYSTYIFENVDRIIIDSPDIDILKDGSIIVNWETEVSSFTIIFDKNPADFSYYYAKVKNDQMPPLRYGVNTNIDIDKITTAPWMANNLKYKVAMHSR